MAEEGMPAPRRSQRARPRARASPASASASAPIPIPNTHPTELHELISSKQWLAVIERCGTHPHEVGSSSHLRNERGYTALHTLMAYNQSTRGKELVPVVDAILRAADEIDYCATYLLGDDHGNVDGTAVDGDGNDNISSRINTNEIVEGRTGTTPQREGAWRLLLDQNNKARWSPLALICVHGGFTQGKVTLMKALLRMNHQAYASIEDQEMSQEYQQNILTLLDRQGRSVLHHLLDSVVPSNETFDAVRFVVGMSPSLLFQRDAREGKMPLEYVLERINENPGTRRRHYMNSYGNNDEGMKKNYCMLKLLVESMEGETMRRRREDEASANVNVKQSNALVAVSEQGCSINQENSTLSSGNADNNNPEVYIPTNILQSACLLPQSVCPSNGSLVTYLSSLDASKMEAKVRDDENKSVLLNMAAESDEHGNLALHLFVSNKSYANDASTNCSADAAAAGESGDSATNDSTSPHTLAESKIMAVLLERNHSAISIRNGMGQLPLQIAMKSGRRQAVALLVLEDSEAVLFDDIMDNIKLFMHVLACVSLPRKLCPTEEDGGNGNANNEIVKEVVAKRSAQCLETIFELVRARPEIVSLGGCNGPKMESRKADVPKKKKWWKRLNIFE